MGCRNSRPEEEVIVRLSRKNVIAIGVTEDGAMPIEPNDDSLRDFSVIQFEMENDARKFEDDASVVAVLKEIN
jgi:hypothetical protein